MGEVWLVGVSGAVIYHLFINVHLPCKGKVPMVPYEKCTGVISLSNLIWKICFLVTKETLFWPIQGRIQEFGKVCFFLAHMRDVFSPLYEVWRSPNTGGGEGVLL